MHSSEAVMPISVEPYVDESGIGYCLRAISANGATLHGLRRLLEIDNIGRFTARHATALARLFQTSPIGLRRHFQLLKNRPLGSGIGMVIDGFIGTI